LQRFSAQNLWIEDFAGTERHQKQIPCGDDKKKGNGESKTTKAKGCAKSAAFSNVYISILVN
jgi:hypothetical protein